MNDANQAIRQYIDPSQELQTTRRYVHRGCSDGKDAALCVTRFPGGWRWYCHRCAKGGVVGLDGLPPSATARAAAAAKLPPRRTSTGAIKLPYDFTNLIPDAGLVWLWKYYITEADNAKYGIGYSKQYHRIILPVYQNNELVYWQGRWFERELPMGQRKYLNVRAERGSIYFRLEDHPNDDRIVLVEDILSGINVGRVVNCLSLLTATVSDQLIIDLSKKYKTIIIWLDADRARYTTGKLKRYRTLGYPVKRIFTAKDPKCYPINQIKETLNNGD